MDLPPALRDLSNQTRDGGYNHIEIGNISGGRSYSSPTIADSSPSIPMDATPQYTPLERAAALSAPHHVVQ